MPDFEFVEEYQGRRRNYCSIGRDAIARMRQESLEADENFDEFVDRVHEYIWESPWDFIDDDECIDEETTDRDMEFDELDDWLYGEYHDSFEETEEEEYEDTEEGKVCIGELR
jgi:hypothetical protein